ncbi:hypothetical protein APTSU1_001509100 [Apodemus speciosus]|uniref:Uncharacterized protein n=1 Tax=Apodemus speciosus TaxID=105296 RepID=A0ABQ0FKU9_APOSI
MGTLGGVGRGQVIKLPCYNRGIAEVENVLGCERGTLLRHR